MRIQHINLFEELAHEVAAVHYHRVSEVAPNEISHNKRTLLVVNFWEVEEILKLLVSKELLEVREDV